MTAAVTDLDAGQLLITSDSPGGLGYPEIWADADLLEELARGSAGGTLINLAITFVCNKTPVTYAVISRRWSHANGGRPYYVLAWPD